jgi:tRNA pseudouridine55 synthase
MQVPPIFSAIKQGGKPVYKAARRGEEVIIEPRPITIKVFEITQIELPKLYFRVVCSTGTYIRSLANDFGAALGVGGHLSSLRRTRIGDFLVHDAQTIEGFGEEVKKMAGGVTVARSKIALVKKSEPNS